MGTENIEVTILSAEKETITLHAGGEIADIITTAVNYVAVVSIPNSRCEIKGTFRFKDTEIMEERWIVDRISGLFKVPEDFQC